MSLFTELKRRKVFRVAVVYAATAFAVLQAADIMLPRVGVPDWVMNLVVVLTVLGFPIALVLAWALELKPDGGIRRTEASDAASSETPPLLGRRTLLIAGFFVVLGIGLGAGWLLKPGGPSSDLYSHILLDLAAGTDPATLPAEEVARAREEHERRLREAARVAPNAAARDFIEITRRNLSDDWTGLGSLVRRALDHTEACGFDQWLHVNGLAFGMAEPARDFFLRATRCNALDEAHWLHAAIASIYAGNAARALEITERGLETANVAGFGLEEVRLLSLIALGRLDEAGLTWPPAEPMHWPLKDW